MTAVATGLAVLAALLLVTPRPGRGVLRRLRDPAGPAGAGSRRGRRRFLLGALALLASAAGGGLLGGSEGATLALTAGLVAGTAWSLVAQHRRRLRVRTSRRQVAEACAVLAAQIRVGRVPSEALRVAAEDCPVLAEAAVAVRLGGQPATVWRRAAETPGQLGLVDLARAWQLAELGGAPMADTLEQVAETLSEDRALAHLVEAELAAPRATGRIMAVLPVAGIGLGYLIGGHPLAFLLGNRYGQVCLLLGTGLAVTGVLWMERIATRAAEAA